MTELLPVLSAGPPRTRGGFAAGFAVPWVLVPSKRGDTAGSPPSRLVDNCRRGSHGHPLKLGRGRWGASSSASDLLVSALLRLQRSDWEHAPL